MSVYVDQMMACVPNRNWHHGSNCHLYADTREELIEFATRWLGLREKWLQNSSSLLHFDLTANMRRKAISLGAIEHSHEQTGRFIRHERLRRAAPEIKCLIENDGHEWRPMKSELMYCPRCMGCEGGTPTHCPGKVMSALQQRAVYDGDIDFRDGRWWSVPTVHMAHAHGFRRHGKVVFADGTGPQTRVGGRGEIHLLNNVRYDDVSPMDFVYVRYDSGLVRTGVVIEVEYAAKNGKPGTTVAIAIRGVRP